MSQQQNPIHQGPGKVNKGNDETETKVEVPEVADLLQNIDEVLKQTKDKPCNCCGCGSLIQ